MGSRSASSENTLHEEHKDDIQEKHQSSDGQADHQEEVEKSDRADGKIELQEHDAEHALGFSYPVWKKWYILTVVLLIQIAINSNASMYSHIITGMQDKYGVGEWTARLGQALFLIAYAFGCELWAPWSEEIGRWPTEQLSLLLINIWTVCSALSPTFGGVLAARILGGLSTAGGSVTLGMIADLYRPEDTGFQYAVAYVVLSSVGGAVVGTVIASFVVTIHSDPTWVFWVMLMMGGAVQLIHLFTVPETLVTVLIDREAKRQRKESGANSWGPNELKENRFAMREIWTIWYRPFKMFFTEPIVLCLSLLSGFADSLIFSFFAAFGPIFAQWNFNTWQVGLTFVAAIVSYILAFLSYLPVIHHHNKVRRDDPDKLSPESRLWWLLWLAPCLPLGLFGFAFTSFGPEYTPWIAPILFVGVIGLANYSIYKSSIDYMIAAYGPYAASATGGNDLARDFLAGLAALYTPPFYGHFHTQKYKYVYPTVIFGCIAVVVIIPIYIYYWKGPAARMKSPFAQQIEKKRQERLANKKGGKSGGGGEKSQKGTQEHVEEA